MPDDGLEPLEPETLVIENEVLRQGFTIIPNYVLKDPTISPGAKTTFMLLLSYAWQAGSCFPGQERLSRELGVGKRSIIRWLQELEEHKIIASRRRGLGKTNLYLILDVEKSPSPRSDTSRSAKLALQEMPKSTHPKVPKSAHKENTVYKNTEQQQVVVAREKKGRNKENNNSSGERPQVSAVVQELTALGIAVGVAERLADRYKADRIYQKLDYLRHLQETNPKKVSNPRGWLRKAIEEDYGPPDGYKTPEQKAAEAEEETRKQQEREQWLSSQEQRPQRQSWSAQLIEAFSIDKPLQKMTKELHTLLRLQMTVATFETWASRTLITQVEGQRVSIAVPSRQAYEWLANRLKVTFEDALSTILGEEVAVEFAVVPSGQGSE